MTIPNYQALMLPLLQLVADGQDHFVRDLHITLANQLNLSDAERGELLPSGRQTVFANRIGWATTYLRKALLLQSVAKGRIQITPRGQQLLATAPPMIDNLCLEQYPEFNLFKNRAASTATSPAEEFIAADRVSNDDKADPTQAFYDSFKTIQQTLADQLLERVKGVSPQFFEQLVIDVLVGMGYGGSRAEASASITQSSNDGGIDGVIKEDPLGLEMLYVQAKRWDNPVHRPKVQEFAGSLQGFGARKGVFITTSSFSQGAIDYVKHLPIRIVLMDGNTLVRHMIHYNVGVEEVDCYRIKEINASYFEPELT